jgi:hypothetical protein
MASKHPADVDSSMADNSLRLLFFHIVIVRLTGAGFKGGAEQGFVATRVPTCYQ